VGYADNGGKAIVPRLARIPLITQVATCEATHFAACEVGDLEDCWIVNARCDNFAATWCAMIVALTMCGATRDPLGQIPCNYEVIATIQGPNCPFVGPGYLQPEAISPNGLYVTGWYQQCDSGDEAFLWIGPPPGVRIKIPRPVGIESAKGYDVNDSGVVTGLCFQSDAMRGFVWKYQSGQWIALDPPQPGGEVQPYAINNAKYGSRNIIPITGGTTTGKVAGRILNGGADYQLSGSLDAWYTLAPDNGEFILVRNCGASGGLIPWFEAKVDGNYNFLNTQAYLSSAPGVGGGGVSITFYERN
jgi:hypothetical protein